MITEFEKYAIKHLGIGSHNLHQYENIVNGYNITNSQTPYILEERSLQVTQMDVFSRLMMDRIIWINSGINSSMASIIQAQLLFLDSLADKDITMYINSPGGSVDAGNSILDSMAFCKNDIATTNIGNCASMASVILSSGTKGKRSGLVLSKVMTHMVSHGSQGNIQDTRGQQYEAEKCNYILFKTLAENCDRTFDEIHDISRYDRWFDSEEAVEFGLIDKIIGVTEKRNMSRFLDGYDDYYEKEFKHTVQRKYTTKKNVIKKQPKK